MNRNKLGIVLICLGLVLILGALTLTGINLYDQQQAAVSSQVALEELMQQLPQETFSKTEPVEDTLLSIEHLKKETVDYLKNPYMPMPVTNIDGIDYIGYLEIPSLGLTLPVISETTSGNLLKAPCRFFGSAYTGDLVIGAHNYATHFGRIWELGYGDRVIFTDMAGNVFVYEVADMETLRPYEGSQLCNGLWDLTLYTCTFGGEQRMTIRCEQVNAY